MAAALLAARLPGEWQVASAGVAAVAGDPPTPAACAVLAEQEGLEIGDRRSQPLTVELIEQADHVLVMSHRQARYVAALAPRARARIRLYGAFAPEVDAGSAPADPGGPPATADEVPDPIGADLELYRACVRRLARAADRIAAWLRAGAPADQAPPPALDALPAERSRE